MFAQRTNILIVLGIVFCFNTSLQAVIGRSQFTMRSQGINNPRHWVGMEPYDFCDKTTGFPCFYFGITPAYSESFSNGNLEQYLFFNGTDSMRFGNLNNPNTDVFARNFLLNDDFEGSVEIEPLIKNMTLEMQMRISLNKITRGLYFEAYVPITWSRWDLVMAERFTSAGTFVDANKLGNPQPANSPLRSIIRAWMGDTINENIFPAVQQDMGFATVDGRRTEVGISDLYLTLGYELICRPDWAVDLQLNYIAPVGKKIQPHFFFNAQVGNGRHNGLGGGIHGFHEVFDKGDTAMNVVFDIRYYYLFSTHQRRTFDLIGNGIGSRYLLFKRFNPDGTATGEIVFGPRVTTLDCNVKVGAEVEGTIMATYDWYSWQFNAGLDAWLRSKEGITLRDGVVPLNTFGIQGNTDSDTPQTASATRINGENANIFDDPFTVFLTQANINVDSAANPLAVSYTLFLHASKFWSDNPLEPFVGIGAALEFSAISNRALEQGTIWIKAGFSYA